MINTLKRQKLIKNLETSKNLREASLKAGYSANSRQIYTPNTRQYISNAIHSNPEKIKERFEHLGNCAERKKDWTNALRANEDLAKLNGLMTEHIEIKAVRLTEEEIEEYKKLKGNH